MDALVDVIKKEEQAIYQSIPTFGNRSIGAGPYYQPSLKQRLDEAVVQAKEKLKIAEEARKIFDRNPDLEQLLDLMQKGAF